MAPGFGGHVQKRRRQRLGSFRRSRRQILQSLGVQLIELLAENQARLAERLDVEAQGRERLELSPSLFTRTVSGFV